MATFRSHPSDVKDYNPAANAWANKLQSLARSGSVNQPGLAKGGGGDADGMLLGKTTTAVMGGKNKQHRPNDY